MGRLLGLIKKEFIQFSRDKIVIASILYHYTLCIILCGYCWTYDIKHLRTLAYDMNRSRESRDLINRFIRTEYFTLRGYVDSLEQLKREIDAGRATLGIVIPPNFSKDIGEGREAKVQIIVDGTKANQAAIAFGYTAKIVKEFCDHIQLERIIEARKMGRDMAAPSCCPPSTTRGFPPTKGPTRIENQVRIWYNPDLKSSHFVALGHVVIAAMIGGLLLPGAVIVRERELGTIDQLLVTPIRPWEFILAKILSPIGLGMICLIPSFLITFFIFRVPFKGNPLLFVLVSLIFLITETGIGVLIATLCQNYLQVLLISWFLISPGSMLAGTTSSITAMPKAIQYITYLNPTRHYMDATVAIFLKGVGLEVLWPKLLVLIILGAILYILSIWRLHKTLY